MSDGNLNSSGHNDDESTENSQNEEFPLKERQDNTNTAEQNIETDSENLENISSYSDEADSEKSADEAQNNVDADNNEEELNQETSTDTEENHQQYENPQNQETNEQYSGQQNQGYNNQYQNPQNNGNQQNPYSPYGQYNQYGNYQNPYNNYNNSYGNGNGNQPYWTYQQYGNQYQQQNQQNMPPQPPKKNKGLKVFLWILGTLIGVFVIGFCSFGIYSAVNQTEKMPEIVNSQPNENNEGGTVSEEPKVESKVPGDGTDSNTLGITIKSKPSGSELKAKEVYKKVVESVVGVETTIVGASQSQSGIIQGTGIVASSSGYLLTNAHVVNYSRNNKVKVIFHNNKQFEATVVGFDKTSDLAVLKINANNLTPAEFGNADQLEIGDHVIAIGNPGGLSYSSSLTGGYVSALNRKIESHSDNGMTYIQTDAAINPGNSGGPLVNMYGQVIGINSNKIVATGYEGMGFAIPVSRAKTIIDDLIKNGYVSGRSRLGVTVSDISEIQSQLSGYPQGVMIREICAESDLNKSNVAVGDVITKADGKEIRGMEDLFNVLNSHKAGDTITLTIFRMGTTKDNSVTRNIKTTLLEDKGETQK